MKRLCFTYRTFYTFDSPVYDHYYTFKIYPRDNERQQVIGLSESMDYGDSHSYSFDTFGNKMVYGCIHAPHDSFYFDVSGTVQVDGRKRDTDACLLSLFDRPSEMTQITPVLRETLDRLIGEAPRRSCYRREFGRLTDLERALYLSDCCYELLEYTPNVTSVTTDASHALRLGKGVCQDYAHVLLAFLRMLRIPARYVVGFMLGEGFTHAWVEVYCGGFWHGLDPTNSRLVDEGYIKLSHGRDYRDTMVCKGHFYGMAEQHQEIQVQVSEQKRR